jgi:hypothetical protein
MVAMAEATYELRLRGPLSTRTIDTFQEMDMRLDTILSCVVVDQAALHGLLERIRDLGLELIDVHQIDSGDA